MVLLYLLHFWNKRLDFSYKFINNIVLRRYKRIFFYLYRKVFIISMEVLKNIFRHNSVGYKHTWIL